MTVNEQKGIAVRRSGSVYFSFPDSYGTPTRETESFQDALRQAAVTLADIRHRNAAGNLFVPERVTFDKREVSATDNGGRRDYPVRRYTLASEEVR